MLLGSGISTHISEPAHDKTYNTTCATSEDPDQPGRPLSLIRDCFALNG